MFRPRLVAVGLLTVASASVMALFTSATGVAGGARVFEQTTQEDFEQGEGAGTTILPTGEVAPGLKSVRVDLPSAFVWCATLSVDGKTAFFGTGDEGAVYAIPVAAPARPAAAQPRLGDRPSEKAGDKPGDKDKPADKPGDKNEAARLVIKLPEPWVTALVVRADGSLLAATTPGGKIYEINPRDGTRKLFATVKADHIWALVADRASGETFAATGGTGKIVVIDRKGGMRTLWDAADQHVVSLIDAGGGNLLAGTSDSAILYRVGRDGRALALHDFDADEVRAIARQGDVTFVAVNDFETGAETPSAPAAAKGTKVEIVASGKSPAAVGKLPRPGAPKAKGAIYRLEKDGSIEQLHALAEGYFTALSVERDGTVHAAAGIDGKVYRIGQNLDVSLALDLPERQALTLLSTPPSLLVGTGDLGAVFRAAPAPTDGATYLSKVFDAVYQAHWGWLRYGAPTAVKLETRAGSTAKPDASWEDWKVLAQPSFAAAGDEGQGRIASSPARYLQYRAILPRDGSLRDISLHHAPQNQRARVTDLTLDGADKKAVTKAAGDPARQHSSVLKLRFKVQNPDEDPLIYQLSYRQEGEPVWRSLGPTDPLSKPEFDWNTESVPDGRYVVRVWASDGQAVAQDQALSYTFVSPPLLVDNSRPEVTGLVAKLPAIEGRAADAASRISQIEFSINGGEWRPASAVDGILDQKTENFSLQLPRLPAGVHVISVRAFDAADNVGVARLVITTK